jgi:beta-xylosidase
MSFLYEQGLTPVFVVSSGDAAKSEYISWLKELFQHMIYCFGIRLFHVEALWESAIHQRAEALEYREFVHSLRNLFQSMKADCDLYGPGVQLTGDGSNLETCLQANPELDHITIRCAPAGVVSRNIKPARTIPEPDYLIHQCRLAQEIVRKNKPESDLLITGWRTSLGNANVLNDSSWFGARIVQTALSGYGVLPSLPLECPLELFGNNSDLGFFLRGREGLMTLNRLPKPSFHALHFLKHLDEYHLYHDRHMIVSASADGFIQIVIQNSSPLSHQYYFYDEETISKPVPIPHTFYESLEPYEVCLRLTGVSNGQWMMKTRIVNDSVGSVFQAWLTLNYQNDSFIGKDETELMRAKALPDIRGNTVTSSKGVLEVPLNMGPNEIRHIHLIPIR